MNHYQPYYKQLDEFARKSFPSLSEISAVGWEYLISPYTIELPRSVLVKAQTAVSSFYQLSRRESYQKKIGIFDRMGFPIPNDSVLMAYDFHSDPSGELQLVEINTNASGYLLAALMGAAHDNVADVNATPVIADLKKSFTEEGLKSGMQVAIVDDDIATQKMLLEFLMYRDLFGKWGCSAKLEEATALKYIKNLEFPDGKEIDFVYNRSTDFYFAELEHDALRTAWSLGHAIVSPQPKEYFLLADKERLIEFAQPEWLKAAGANAAEIAAISAVSIPTFEIKDFGSQEELWAKRKTLFFKPKHSHGGKSVYRGESVSKKVFDRLMHEDILIQKFVPASHIPGHGADDPLENWKFDLRFFVYRDRIQQVAARIYQGQVTNFASPFGGFTSVKFI